ncbi:MAG: hypothetical protein CO141_03280 [Candidatus Moranbacteria bacterium CG_4_9_14_3_um_filter_42_9]|nr:MAG: hypothetical protein CO141_03280 [Candidatus Moranbacteria bacterium CG_4_9_14_3_um_filter_42_9]
MNQKIIGWLLLSALAVHSLLGNNWFVEDDPFSRRPEISNARFSIHNRTVKVRFDYKGVAGHIRDAKLVLTVLVAVKHHEDRFEPLLFKIGGWKGLLWTAECDQRTTRGTSTAVTELPEYLGIDQNTKITGLGLGFKNSGGMVAIPVFINGEIIHETKTERMFRLLKEALT